MQRRPLQFSSKPKDNTITAASSRRKWSFGKAHLRGIHFLSPLHNDHHFSGDNKILKLSGNKDTAWAVIVL
jgi:hypothetical protein